MNQNMIKPSLDRTGKKVTITPDGLVKLDGVIIFRTVERNGAFCLQFVDHDRLRVQCRGSRYIEIPLDVLMNKIQGKENADEQPTTSTGINEQQPGSEAA